MESKQYIIHQESGKTIPIHEQLVVAREWIAALGKKFKGVEDAHALFIPKNGKIFLRAMDGGTYYSGNIIQPGEEICLEHNGVVVFGHKRHGAVFIFKDIEQKARILDTQKLKSVRFDFSVLKSAAEKMGRELFNKAPASLYKFAEYLLDFLFDKFRVQRGVIYRIEGKRWIPIRARAMSARFLPPKMILTKVWESKEPCRFVLPEAQDTGDISKSIVDSHVQSAICFPMLNRGNLIGVLYIDTQKESVILSQDDLIVLCTLMPGVAGYMNALLTYEQERLEADALLSSMLPKEKPELAGYVLEPEVVNKGVQSFSLIKRGDGSSVFFLYARFTPKSENNRDSMSQVAAYSGLLAVLEFVSFDPDKLRDFVKTIAEYLHGKFPTLHIGVGICCLHAGKIRFVGVGEVYLVVKPPERSAFITEPSDKPYTEGQDDVLPLEYDIIPGVYFCMVEREPEGLCSVFDRVTNISRVREDISGMSGALFCRIGVSGDAGEGKKI